MKTELLELLEAVEKHDEIASALGFEDAELSAVAYRIRQKLEANEKAEAESDA